MFYHSCNGFLANKSVVLIVCVILRVPLKLGIEVHVEVGLTIWLILHEVFEGHGLTRKPLQLSVAIDVHPTQPVVSSVLRAPIISQLEAST